MDRDTVKKIKGFIQKIEKLNNKTENKIDVLKTILIEYNELSTLYDDFGSYSIRELINQINLAKTKRKNVSKQYLHKEFLRIKEDSLFKINYNYSLVKFKIEKTKNKQINE